MELSVRDAKARFSEALEAAARGERVVVTKHGKPFVEMGPAKRGGFDFERAARIREEMGWQDVKTHLPDDFDDPAFSRKMLGLEE
jgi:antitoxin (DNA-binding transcriptional repressor) of toxin-antitoxin stability system